MFSKDIEPYVTLPMWRVLVELWHNGDFRLGELAEQTDIDFRRCHDCLSPCSARADRAPALGLDGRALSLTLTPRGMELTERIVPHALHYEDVAMRGLSDGDVKRERNC